MESVKIYWQNPIFLAGIFLCAIGTILGAFEIATAGVIVEVLGIGLMMTAIVIIEKRSSDEKSLY